MEKPTEEQWKVAVKVFQQTLLVVNEIEPKISNLNGGYIHKSDYLDLFSGLKQRADILDRLINISPPLQPEELAKLKEIKFQYVALMEKSGQLKGSLGDYMDALQDKFILNSIDDL